MLSTTYKVVECKQVPSFAIKLSPSSINALQLSCYVLSGVSISPFSLISPADICMTVFPDSVVKEDEVLVPVWLARQLKGDKITLIKVHEQSTQTAGVVHIRKIKDKNNTIQHTELPPPLPHFEGFLQDTLDRLLLGSSLSKGSKFAIDYFGRTHIFEVTKVTAKQNTDFKYRVDKRTTFVLDEETKNKQTEITLEGLEETIETLENYLKSPSGVLLCGVAGIGKSTLVKHVLCNPKVFHVMAGEFESAPLPAFRGTESAVVIDGLDYVRSHGTAMRVAGFLDACIDAGIPVVGVMRDPALLDASLRRARRFDHVVTIPTPDQKRRVELLRFFLSFNQFANSELLEKVGDITRGFVARDLAKLCRMACVHAVRRAKHTSNTQSGNLLSIFPTPTPTIEDFIVAQTTVKASQVVEFHTNVKSVKWQEVGGFGELKDTLLKQIVWPITNPETFRKLGLTAPAGILLHGAPGCGKTHLALGLASAAGVNQIYVSGPQLYSKWLGETERKVRELFKQARNAAPCVVIIDEIDALGATRTDDTDGASGVGWRVLSQLLAELDGVNVSIGGAGVTVIGCTSRVDLLDSALIRPGRLTTYMIPTPTQDDVLAILQLSLKDMWANLPVEKDPVVTSFAAKLQGCTPAKIVSLCWDAGLLALKDKEEPVLDYNYLERAFNKLK